MTNQLIIDAFNMTVARSQVEPGMMLYSDRGVQYRSGEYQHLLNKIERFLVRLKKLKKKKLKITI